MVRHHGGPHSLVLLYPCAHVIFVMFKAAGEVWRAYLTAERMFKWWVRLARC
jgi:hypothetical protein